MQIQVLYFAVFRERLGTSAETLELEASATVADAISALAERHPPIAALRGRFRVARNQSFAADDEVLTDGDELALIPPVAGGSDTPYAPYARVLSTELSLDRCLAAVRSGDSGGIVTFTGMVRRHNRGQTIDHLEYEAYGEMAVKEMVALIRELEAEVPGSKLAVEHRIGRLEIGDIAVVIAAAAPHRAEAFTACRAMIDRLKDRVPIWKKETGVSGEEWIGLGP
jgi:MoaE-MoaD fusion protein